MNVLHDIVSQSITGRAMRALLGVALLTLAGGCIGDGRRAAADTGLQDGDALDASDTPAVAETTDATVDDLEASDVLEVIDTEVEDTEVVTTEVEETEVEDSEVVEVETTEVVDTSEIVQPPECTSPSDCDDREAPPVCRRWTCANGACVIEPENDGAPCDDHDPCTLGDECRGAQCEAGLGRPECPGDPASRGCLAATCVPMTGCGLMPALANTPCSNGGGVAPSTCVFGGFQGEDHCDGQGACTDAPEPSPSMPGAAALDGTWFMVYTTFGRYGELATGRGVLGVAAETQTFDVTQLFKYGPVPLSNGDSGFLCANDDGRLEAKLGLGEFVGHHLDMDLAVVSDTHNDGLGVLLRADGGVASQVSGTYAYFQTTVVFGESTPTTWRGSVSFTSGCMLAGSLVADQSVSVGYDFTPKTGGDCLVPSGFPGEGALFELATSVRAQSGDTTKYPINYRGAIGRGGDVVLLVKEADITTRAPEYGLTLLVRESTTGFAQRDLAGAWYYYQHALLDSTPPRRDVGSVNWTDSGTISGGALGTLDGDVVTPRGWALTHGMADISQRLEMSGLTFHQSGVVDPSAKLIVGWVVGAPANSSLPVVLGDVPRGGSMLLMLRPD